MPESLSNPFREPPKGLNPDDEEFFEKFVPDYKPDEAAQPRQGTADDERGIKNDETIPETLDSIADEAEKERFNNETVTCANIEITRKQERQIQDILKKLNQERQQNGLESVELGKEINLHKVTIGGMTKEELEQELEQKGNKISSSTQSMLNNPDFTTQEHREQNILIKLTVSDLGFPQGATTEEIFNKALELGMELCPAETGPQFRLQYQDQPTNEWIYVGMKQITDSDGNPKVFNLERSSDGLWLSGSWARPTDRWSPGTSFVFRPSQV